MCLMPGVGIFKPFAFAVSIHSDIAIYRFPLYRINGCHILISDLSGGAYSLISGKRDAHFGTYFGTRELFLFEVA